MRTEIELEQLRRYRVLTERSKRENNSVAYRRGRILKNATKDIADVKEKAQAKLDESGDSYYRGLVAGLWMAERALTGETINGKREVIKATKNKKLRLWLDLGLCRGAALARYMGVSRQYIDSRANGGRGISDSQWLNIEFAMTLVEDDESKDRHYIEQNILKSANLCTSTNKYAAEEAKRNLDKWVMILGRL